MARIKVAVIFGTRPEAIKMAPVVRALESTPELFEPSVIVTAQHREMLDQVLKHFDLVPTRDLDIMTPRQSLTGILTRALDGLTGALNDLNPDLVLVHGDTATTLAGSLAAYFSRITLGHVEAGLRTYDKYAPFPEEMMRCLTDQLADLHFAPTMEAKQNLLSMNCPAQGIFVTGNTVIDALLHTVSPEYRFCDPFLATLDFRAYRVVLVDVHRRENFGQPMENICLALKDLVSSTPDLFLVCSVHMNPEVSNLFHHYLAGIDRVRLSPPLDYPEWSNLLARSYLVMTDSGGLQEEAPSLGTPVVLLRDKTERPEALRAGTVLQAGTERTAVVKKTRQLLHDENEYVKMSRAMNPYGDGQAANRIAQAIAFHFGRRQSPPGGFGEGDPPDRDDRNPQK